MIDEEENKKFIECCGDDRFEIIKRAREHIIDVTNIESRPEEMKVLDNFLFKCWQMGWLKNDFHQLEKENAELKKQEEILLDRILTLQKTNGSLTDKINVLESQIKKIKNIIYEEIDFCSYCPLKDCRNDEGICPCANISKEEQEEMLIEWITKNES